MSMSSGRLVLDTSLGAISLDLLSAAAPLTVNHIKALVSANLYDNCCFYRSDFVIQCGLQTPDGRSVPNPYDDLSVNESQSPANKAVGNKRGTAAVAHWDVPDCGNSEFFINLSDNMHLNDAYGGYCVFAQIQEEDNESWETVDRIANVIKNDPQQRPRIHHIQVLLV